MFSFCVPTLGPHHIVFKYFKQLCVFKHFEQLQSFMYFKQLYSFQVSHTVMFSSISGNYILSSISSNQISGHKLRNGTTTISLIFPPTFSYSYRTKSFQRPGILRVLWEHLDCSGNWWPSTSDDKLLLSWLTHFYVEGLALKQHRLFYVSVAECLKRKCQSPM